MYIYIESKHFYYICVILRNVVMSTKKLISSHMKQKPTKQKKIFDYRFYISIL